MSSSAVANDQEASRLQPTKRSVSFRSSPHTSPISTFTSEHDQNSNATNAGSSFGHHLEASSSSSNAGFDSGATTASSSLSSSPLKPALKPSSRKLPPKEQYHHPDPLIRRLRLVDDKGSPVNLKQYFRDCKVLALYFSSQWAGMPLKEYQQTIGDFQRRHPHEFKVVYVSVDVDEEWYKAGVKDKPWVSMVWNDGSSLPSERSETAATRGFGSNLSSPAMSTQHSAQSSSSDTRSDDEADLPAQPKLHNEEDFLLAHEVDIDASLSLTDTSGTSYLRPYSRVHLASKLDILAAPTLAVYHLPSRRLIERNVRVRRMQESERDETWARWSKGEGAGGIGLKDALHANKVMVWVSVFSLLYFILVRVGGEEYNFLIHAINRLGQQHNQG
ncbi:unnamed protein product [Sympodiomycopsis kandeliae]